MIATAAATAAADELFEPSDLRDFRVNLLLLLLLVVVLEVDGGVVVVFTVVTFYTTIELI